MGRHGGSQKTSKGEAWRLQWRQVVMTFPPRPGPRLATGQAFISVQLSLGKQGVGHTFARMGLVLFLPSASIEHHLYAGMALDVLRMV